MAAREVGGQRQLAHVEDFAVANLPNVSQPRERDVKPELRIVLERGPQANHARAPRMQRDRRARRTLQRRQSTGVIVVRVRVQDHLDVFEPESQRADARGNQRCRFWQRGVNEHVASRDVTSRALSPRVPTYQVLPWMRNGRVGSFHAAQASQRVGAISSGTRGDAVLSGCAGHQVAPR